jgi:hypothetical protein
MSIARSWMNDKSRRLVNDEEKTVLVEDVKRHCLRGNVRSIVERHAEDQLIPCFHTIPLFLHCPVDKDAPLFNISLKRGARKMKQL